MVDSILLNIKKKLGLEADYTIFDEDVITHINSALGTLNQLGVGPSAGFQIEDDVPTWEDFLGLDPRLNPAKSYVYLRVRMLFDPPSVGYMITAYEKQIEQLEWRLQVQADPPPMPTTPTDGDVLYEPDVDVVLDGGSIDN